MVKNIKCPKSGEIGSLQPKTIKGIQYWRIGHHAGVQGSTKKTKWCYIGKNLPEDLRRLLTQEDCELTQGETPYPKPNRG